MALILVSVSDLCAIVLLDIWKIRNMVRTGNKLCSAPNFKSYYVCPFSCRIYCSKDHQSPTLLPIAEDVHLNEMSEFKLKNGTHGTQDPFSQINIIIAPAE